MAADPSLQLDLAARVDALALERPWARRLALELTRDPHAAEDLVQDACLAFLRSRPATEGSLRSWLATVVRNRARSRWRSDSRRREREADAAREECSAPSTHDVLERATAHQSLVDAVLALDEPYRRVLLQRYFDGLEPGEIARRAGAPVSTVKTQLQRGLARLRERFGSDPERPFGALLPLMALAAPGGAPGGLTTAGPARPWAAALREGAAPLSYPLSTTLPLFTVLAMSSIAKLAALSVLFAGGLYLAWPEGRDEAPLEARAATREPAAPANMGGSLAAVEDPATRAAARAARAAVDSSTDVAESGAEVAPAARTFDVQGRVLDASALPLVGAALRFVGLGGEERELTSGVDGVFHVDGLSRGGRVESDDPRYATVYAGAVHSSHVDALPVVVLARRVSLAGVVVDAAGRPVEGAVVEPRAPEGLRARFEAVMDFSDPLLESATADGEGRFELDAPALAGAVLHVSHREYLAASLPMPGVDDLALRIVLERPALDGRTLTGLVLEADGAPASGAQVSFGVHGTTTDERGVFRLGLDDPESPNVMARRFGLPPSAITAVKEGHLPARLDLELDPSTEEPLLPDAVVLTLGGTPLSVEGRVVDEGGAPLAGIEVWARDGQLLEFGADGPRTVEAVLGGGGRGRRAVTTAADGRFRLEGLMDRPYFVAAHDPATLLRVEAEVPAGAGGVTLVLDRGGLWRRVAGTVVDGGGRPVAGVVITPATDTFFVRAEGRIVSTQHGRTEQVVRTDEAGRFELADVPRDLVYLRLDGEDILSEDWGRHVEGGLAALSDGRVEALEIVARVRVHLQVHVADATEADSFRVLDEAGEPLVVELIEARRRMENETMPLVEGRSDVVTVDDRGRTLVLLREGVEVRRAPLDLRAGDVNRIDL